MQTTTGNYIRRLEFDPGFDYRDNPELAKYGQHPMELCFGLIGRQGALVFAINTGWAVLPESRRGPQYCLLSTHKYLTEDPTADEDKIKDECGWLDGEACVGDHPFGFSSPTHDELLTLLISEGEDALWERLETLYEEVM